MPALDCRDHTQDSGKAAGVEVYIRIRWKYVRAICSNTFVEVNKEIPEGDAARLVLERKAEIVE